MFENMEENLYLNHSETGFGYNANLGHNLASGSSNALRSIVYRVS